MAVISFFKYQIEIVRFRGLQERGISISVHPRYSDAAIHKDVYIIDAPTSVNINTKLSKALLEQTIKASVIGTADFCSADDSNNASTRGGTARLF